MSAIVYFSFQTYSSRIAHLPNRDDVALEFTDLAGGVQLQLQFFPHPSRECVYKGKNCCSLRFRTFLELRECLLHLLQIFGAIH